MGNHLVLANDIKGEAAIQRCIIVFVFIMWPLLMDRLPSLSLSKTILNNDVLIVGMFMFLDKITLH